jgi:hypothetical protein
MPTEPRMYGEDSSRPAVPEQHDPVYVDVVRDGDEGVVLRMVWYDTTLDAPTEHMGTLDVLMDKALSLEGYGTVYYKGQAVCVVDRLPAYATMLVKFVGEHASVWKSAYPALV